MIELASDALLRPTLVAQEFEKERALAIQSLAAAKDSDPRALVAMYGDAWLFRGHPYGRPVSGDEQSLAAVTLDDLKRQYQAQVRGDRLIIAVVGDFDAASVRQRLEQAFGSLPRASRARACRPGGPATSWTCPATAMRGAPATGAPSRRSPTSTSSAGRRACG